MNRRQFLAAAATAAAGNASALAASRMGLATTSFMTVRRPRETYEFLEYAHSLGAGGIQASLSSLDAAYIRKLRARAEELGMFLEVMTGLPRKDDPSQFERTAAAAREAGALCLRAACLGGRRYETFKTLVDWQRFITGSREAIERALPIVEKHAIPLALENHKDWTRDELTSLMKDHRSRWLGVCLDTGNNIALLDDPMAVVEALAPYAISTHIKDMGVEPYEHGFLLSELPLGEGFLDIKRIVATIRKARPDTRFTLEMITRNPLEVPCLNDAYWITFPDRGGVYLARMLRLAAAQRMRRKLPRIDDLNRDAQMRLEEDNVKRCLYYAREQLGL